MFGPLYGVLIYLYITHLILSGAPFTSDEEFNSKQSNSISKNSCEDFTEPEIPIVEIPGFRGLDAGDDKDIYEPIMSKETSHYIGAGIGGTIGLGITLASPWSPRTRCSTVLMIPSLMTKRGRGFILTFVTGLVLTGPVNTIQFNLQEIVRSFTCMYCQVKGLVEQFGNEFKRIMSTVRNILQQMEEMVQETKQILTRLADEAVGDQKQQIEAARQKMEDEANKVKEVASALNQPGEWISSACGSIVSGVQNAAEEVGGFFEDVGNTIAGWFGRKKRSSDGCGIPNVLPGACGFILKILYLLSDICQLKCMCQCL